MNYYDMKPDYGSPRAYNNAPAPYNPKNYNPQNYKKRSGAKLTKYKNGKGEVKVVINAWNASRRGFLTISAHPLGEKGAAKLAASRKYSGKYSAKTEKGNERWLYKAEFQAKDSPAKEYFSGIAIFVPEKQKLYVSRFGMVASCNAPNGGYFGVSRKPKR